jgi:heat shock protein HtpX
MDNLFATHPAVENRIAALQQIAAEMGRDARGYRPAPRPDFTPRPEDNSGWRVPQFSEGEDRRSRGPWG